MSKRWIISYQYHPVHLFAGGGIRYAAEKHDTITIIDRHPAVFIAERENENRDMLDRNASGNARNTGFDDITRVYWAMEVPDDVSDKDLEVLL